MIQWNADLVRRISCTEDEKSDLASSIRTLVEISAKARLEGVKSVAAGSETQAFPLMKYGLTLVSEGVAGEPLEDILAVLLATDPAEGFEFLLNCLAAETVLSISSGDTPEMTLRKLAPYCGAEKALGLLDAARKSGGLENP